MKTPLIIAVDGPAAAGKGTLARRLAAHLGLPHLDTGLLYRATARRVLDAGGDPASAQDAAKAARELRPQNLDRADLRGTPVDEAASVVAAIPAVREALLQFQRRFGQAHGAVLDGRDIGTIVFPDAAVKLFVTASPEELARRRHLEMAARGAAPPLTEVVAEMAARDTRDAMREAAPLRPAEDAVTLDTSLLDAEAVFLAALRILETRRVQ